MSHSENSDEIRVVRWEKNRPITEQEAEASLHKEGYQTFCWNDVPGVIYPRHHHSYDECLWILAGEITFVIEEKDYPLSAGDRLYLPAKTPHTARVTQDHSCTYLVGQRRTD